MRLLALFLLFALPSDGQFSLPARKPVVCSGAVTTCSWPLVMNGYTGIIVTRVGVGPITVWGQTVEPDYTIPFNGGSFYHVAFNSLPPYPVGVQVVLPPNPGQVVTLLLYEGAWTYTGKGAEGDYANANSVFPDCQNGADCPYWWTRPIVPEKGDLLISFADSNTSACVGFRPGPGWAIEATGCNFAVEDKIATVEAPDIGSMYMSLPDGSDNGGSHWLMGLAAYKRTQ